MQCGKDRNCGEHPGLICGHYEKMSRRECSSALAARALTIYNDIDKIMLSKLSDLASTGVYAAAYRIIDVSLTPVRSLVAAAYPQFFRKGVPGRMRATYRLCPLIDRGRLPSMAFLRLPRSGYAPRFCRLSWVRSTMR